MKRMMMALVCAAMVALVVEDTESHALAQAQIQSLSRSQHS